MFRFGWASDPNSAGGGVVALGAWAATLPPGARVRGPLSPTWNGARVLLCGAGLTAKMSLKRKRPSGEIRFCDGTVPTGNETVAWGIGASEPSFLMVKPVMFGATVPGLAGTPGPAAVASPRLET